MLTVENIHKQFLPQGPEVLRGVSLDVQKGDVVAILGPSGSGKTTLLRCINFLEKADQGTMTFDGQTYDMHRIQKSQVAAIRKKTAFVFQNYNLFLNKTVLENVTLGLTVGRGISREQARETGVEALRRVGMAERTGAYPRELSGGQQQRVAIARALASSPEIIYFDEPTSALDPELIGEVLSVMREVAQDGMTMLVVTHEMEFARHVSSHVVFMEEGKIVESGPSRAFFEAPKTERARSFIRSILGQHQVGDNA